MLYSHEYFMRLAIQEAKAAAALGEIPVGAVFIFNDKIVAKSHNSTEMLKDVTAHAELLGIGSAAQALGGKYLKNCTLYVTLEPCVMCAGALYWSQISKVVIGARDHHRGYMNKGIQLHPKTEVICGILEEECSLLMLDFFKERR